MRNILFFTVLILSALRGFVLYAADEKLTITTYYPSPAGVYKNLRLMPGTDPGDCTNANAPLGKLFFNSATSSVYVCSQLAGVYGYRPVPGGTQWNWLLSGNSLYPASTAFNVGVGLTAPNDKLHIGGNMRLGALTVATSAGATSVPGYGNYLFFSGGPAIGTYGSHSDNSDYLWIARYNAGSDYSELRVNIGDNVGGDDKFVVGTTTSAWNPLMTVTNTGWTGLGVSAPVARLDVGVGGAGATSYTARFSSNSSIAGAGGILFDQNSTYAYKLWTQSTHYTHGNLRIAYINRSTGADVYNPILSLANGNVGVGNASPSQPLDVTGNIRASGEMIGTIQSGWGQARHIAGNYGVIQRNDGSDYYILITAAGNQYGGWNSLRPFYIHLADGTVGSQSNMNVAGALTGGEIRSSNGIFRSWQRPNFILALQGDRHLVLYDNNRAIWWSGTNISDGRLKKDVEDLADALPAALSLRAVRFNWKDESMGSKPEIGVIAQDVEKLYPELIFNDKEGNKLVDYSKLSVILLGAVKEQQKKIDSLEKKVESLTEAVESLRRSRRK